MVRKHQCGVVHICPLPTSAIMLVISIRSDLYTVPRHLACGPRGQNGPRLCMWQAELALTQSELLGVKKKLGDCISGFCSIGVCGRFGILNWYFGRRPQFTFLGWSHFQKRTAYIWIRELKGLKKHARNFQVVARTGLTVLLVFSEHSILGAGKRQPQHIHVCSIQGWDHLLISEFKFLWINPSINPRRSLRLLEALVARIYSVKMTRSRPLSSILNLSSIDNEKIESALFFISEAKIVSAVKSLIYHHMNIVR